MPWVIGGLFVAGLIWLASGNSGPAVVRVPPPGAGGGRPPLPPTQGGPPAQRRSSAIITTGPTVPAPTTASMTTTPPAPHRGSPTRPESQATAQVVETSVSPLRVETDAHAMLAALETSSPTAVDTTELTALIRQFQRSYGRNLTMDGEYGPQTRHAAALTLGLSEASLPPVHHYH